MINPEMLMSMMSPQQKANLARVKEMAKDVKALIKTRQNGVEVILVSDNVQGQQMIPQLKEAVVASIAQSLTMLFGIKGTWDRSEEQ